LWRGRVSGRRLARLAGGVSGPTWVFISLRQAGQGRGAWALAFGVDMADLERRCRAGNDWRPLVRSGRGDVVYGVGRGGAAGGVGDIDLGVEIAEEKRGRRDTRKAQSRSARSRRFGGGTR